MSIAIALCGIATLASIGLGLGAADYWYFFAGACCLGGLAYGCVRYRPKPALGWLLFLVSVSITFATQVGYTVAGSPDSNGALLAYYGLSLMGMCLELAAVFTFLRRRLPGSITAVLLDGSIVGMSVWLVMLLTIVEPVLTAAHWQLTAVINSLYYPLDALLVLGAAVLVLCERGRVLSVLLLATTLTLQLAGDVTFGLMEAGRIGPTKFADLCYAASLFALGLAASHPSMPRLASPQSRLNGRESATRVWAAAPLFLGAVEAAALFSPASVGGRVWVAVSLGSLVVALLARVHHTVRANAETQQRLLVSARHDHLTGLPNRSLAEEQLTATANSGWRPAANMGVLIVNVDRLERVNDTFGHDAGDELLREAARRIETVAPQQAVVARIAGDEFCVGLPSVDDEVTATAVANSILAAFEAPFAISVGNVFTTASVGVAVAPLDQIAATTELFRDADTALRRAKDGGQSHLVLYDASMREQTRRRLEIETHLRNAVANGEFRLFHQPIVDVRTGLVTGFEALIRWQHGDRLVPPNDFIPVAEETGLISSIGAWVMKQGLVELREWIDNRACSPYARMSINASARQLRDHDFVGVVDDALRSANLPPSQLWVEITETAILADMDASLDTVRRLRALGVRIALDDFGTGYSSLSHLRKFPIDRIKVDRSFVSNLETNADDRSLVGSILVLARELGKDVVAEGVETAEQFSILGRLGCPKAQGYLLSKPLPAPELLPSLPTIEQRHANGYAPTSGVVSPAAVSDAPAAAH